MFSKAICQNQWVLSSFPTKSHLSLNSSFQLSSSLGIFSNASSSFPVSSKFPNLVSSPFAKSPKRILPPKQEHICSPPTPGGVSFWKGSSFLNIFLQSPESHTTNSLLCIKYYPFLQPSFRCTSPARNNIWL